MTIKRAPSLFDVENEAISELVVRMRQLRRRVVLPLFVACGIGMHLGVAAHATGYWSVIGMAHGGTYVLNKFTVVLAFVLPLFPLIAIGVPIYSFMRAHTRRIWRDEYLARGLSIEWLSSTTNRFP